MITNNFDEVVIDINHQAELKEKFLLAIKKERLEKIKKPVLRFSTNFHR